MISNLKLNLKGADDSLGASSCSLDKEKKNNRRLLRKKTDRTLLNTSASPQKDLWSLIARGCACINISMRPVKDTC